MFKNMKTIITLAFLCSQIASAASRPIPQVGDELVFTVDNYFEQKSKICRSVFEAKLTVKALPANEIDVASVRRQTGGDSGCGKVSFVQKHWIYNLKDSSLVRVIECKTDDESTCTTRDPLPKDEWQNLESLGNCQYIRDEMIAGYSTAYSACPMNASGASDSTLELWKNETLYAPYPFVQMKTTVVMPAYLVKSVITQTLKSINRYAGDWHSLVQFVSE